jgi:asparagine synthase (glutamine-hydrolysing)
MCGICGIVRPKGPEIDAGLVHAMSDTLRHRGPDDAGIWCSPDRRVALGHRRLSIIDL